MKYHEDTLKELTNRLLHKKIKAFSKEKITFEDDTTVHFEMTDSDCCASAEGEWNCAAFEGMVTNIELIDVEKVDSGWGETSMSAKLVIFHNQNPIAQAQLDANNGNGDYYFSVLSVFVNEEQIGEILESRYEEVVE